MIDHEFNGAVMEMFRNALNGEVEASVTISATTHKGNHKWISLVLSELQENQGKRQIYGSFLTSRQM